MASRIHLRWQLHAGGWRRFQARRRRAAILQNVGGQLEGAVGRDPEASAACAAVDAQRGAVARALASLDESLEADRRAYAEVDGWLRTAVILRGILDRRLIRARVRRLEKGLRPLHVHLGEVALSDRLRDGAGKPLAVPPALVLEAGEAQRELAVLEAERTSLLGALGGEAWPPALATVGREVALFATTIAREVRSKLVPSFSGLAGLAAGYWISHTYTDSHVGALFSRLGLHEGGRHVVSSQSYERLNFWGPLAAGALASYVSARIQALVRARYALRAPEEQAATVQLAALAPGDAPRPPER